MALNVELLRASWALLEPHQEEFGTLFYQTMFTDYPEVKYFFQFTNIEKQRVMLLKSIGFVVQNLGNTEQLVTALKEMGRRHLYYKTEKAHYDIVGANLIKTMGLFFKEKFTAEIQKAWTDAYGAIVNIMLSDLEKWEAPEPVIGFEPKPFKLIAVTPVTHDTSIFKFELPEKRKLPLPVGRHVQICVPQEKGGYLTRDYTPTKHEEEGSFELLIKKYKTGPVSSHVHSLKVGDSLLMRGITGAYEYHPNAFKKFVCVAGGTGICPIYQIITQVLKEGSNDTASFELLNANKTPQDALLEKELAELAKKHEGRLQVSNIFSREMVKGSLHGHVTEEVLKQVFSAKSEGTQVLVCGPDGFTKNVVAALKSVGYSDSEIYTF